MTATPGDRGSGVGDSGVGGSGVGGSGVEALKPEGYLPEGYLAESMVIGFRALYGAILLLSLVWATSNIRSVPSDSSAVVLRLGRIDRVREAGLLLAWPRPIEDVVLVPAPTQQIEYRVSIPSSDEAAFRGTSTLEKINPGAYPSPETDLQIVPNDDIIQLRPSKDAENGTYFLTGDGSAVELDATLFFEVTSPAAYLLQTDHVRPALRRIYLVSAVALTANRSLDDFLVVRVVADSAVGDVGARREALRGDLMRDMNERILALRRDGQDLGVEISRIDLVAVLPPIAKAAFDAVLTASQTADQTVAAARTDAARISQTADRERDRILSEARATADERVRQAVYDTASITSLESQPADPRRADQVLRYYRERIAAIMRKVDVTAVDPHGARDLILPGPGQ
jgi:regulator of protease activity HflC (stomatin/prohibitin superfamily)